MLIYPTARAAGLAAFGAVLALFLTALAPGLWSIGLGWLALVVGLIAADAAISPWPSAVRTDAALPGAMQVGRKDTVSVPVSIPGRFQNIESRLETDAFIETESGPLLHSFSLTPKRRGVGKFVRFWLRWQGPLGLVYKQRTDELDQDVTITSDTRAVEREAINLLTRENIFGVKTQVERGEGAEFDSLREFQAGMDTRAIDWKQTARHRELLTREYRNERNHSVIFAIDTGRLMSEPVENDISRLDHALNASLLMTYVSLKFGDRVGYFAFDARPSLKTGVVSGPRAFTLLQRLTAGIDYSAEETNYTLGLTTLSGHLDRRSLIVMFTDFADSTSAELMLANIAPLMKRHLVLFIAFRDPELERLINHEPEAPDDVTRAVIADTLQRERDLVISKLQRMGALIVDAPSDKIGAGLINQYLKVKKRTLL